MRVVGPNCLGIMAPHAKLNASFAAGMARIAGAGVIRGQFFDAETRSR